MSRIDVAAYSLHELTDAMSNCRSIQSAPSCCRQAEIERAQIVLNHSQPGLPQSTTGSASPVFGRTSNAGLQSSKMVLTGVGTTKVARESQAPSTEYLTGVADPYETEPRHETKSV